MAYVVLRLHASPGQDLCRLDLLVSHALHQVALVIVYEEVQYDFSSLGCALRKLYLFHQVVKLDSGLVLSALG